MDKIRSHAVHLVREDLASHAAYEATCNRHELASSAHCACYACGEFFFPEEIIRSSEHDSAYCPHCRSIAVLPDCAISH
jgi:hypothetical protein